MTSLWETNQIKDRVCRHIGIFTAWGNHIDKDGIESVNQNMQNPHICNKYHSLFYLNMIFQPRLGTVLKLG